MRKLDVLKWMIGRGRGKQEFLGARWVPALLGRVPARSQRAWALRLLSLSPHYFFREREPEFSELSSDEYLNLLSERAESSRKKIFERIVRTHLRSTDTAIDYGCGPGYLTGIVSDHVSKIYGIDISRGVLACAKALHGSDNTDWILADEDGLSGIPDGTVDIAFSFHVFQHLTRSSAERALEVMFRKLKKGGKVLLHFQESDETWKTESDWIQDKSLRGRAKLRYGLHCFGMSLDEFSGLLTKTGFSNADFAEMESFDLSEVDDVKGKLIATAFKN